MELIAARFFCTTQGRLARSYLARVTSVVRRLSHACPTHVPSLRHVVIRMRWLIPPYSDVGLTLNSADRDVPLVMRYRALQPAGGANDTYRADSYRKLHIGSGDELTSVRAAQPWRPFLSIGRDVGTYRGARCAGQPTARRAMTAEQSTERASGTCLAPQGFARRPGIVVGACCAPRRIGVCGLLALRALRVGGSIGMGHGAAAMRGLLDRGG